MKNQEEEKKLSSLFKQLGNKQAEKLPEDLKLKDAVFSTIDATALVVDIVDLFTFQFVKAQAEVMKHSVTDNQIPKPAKEELNKKDFFKRLAQKMEKKDTNTEGGD